MIRLHQWVSQQDIHLSTDEFVKKTMNWFQDLSDQDLMELLMTGFIPDDYEENKEQEKLFAKAVEVLISECFKRIGFNTVIKKTKSESEDVQIENQKRAILIDAKTFRLGRSQVAPNVKDFVKLATVEKWISNYNMKEESTAIGGLVVYPSTHEWKKKSEVYKECSNKKLPIVMLSFEILSYLLQEKNSYKPNDLLSLWNYQTIFPSMIQTRYEYWKAIMPVIAKIVHKSLKEVEEELEIFRLYYFEAVTEAKKHLNLKIKESSTIIPQKVEQMSEKEVRSALQTLLLQTETASLYNSLDNILKNRREYVAS